MVPYAPKKLEPYRQYSRLSPALSASLDSIFCYNYVMATRPLRPITFWCEYGSHEVTEDRALGPTPRYCAEHYAEAQRALNALRVKAHRKRQKGPPTGWERPPGWPRK